MRIVCKRSVLVNALQTAAHFVPSRTPKPILYAVKVRAYGDTLTIAAYDLQTGVEVRVRSLLTDEHVALQVETPGEIALPARAFTDIVRKLPAELVRLDAVGHTVTLSSGSVTITLNGMDPREYPQLPEMDTAHTFAVPCDALHRAITRTVFSAATTESRPAITGISWKLTEEQLTLTATDSHRLSQAQVNVIQGSVANFDQIIVPAPALTDLTRILPASDDIVEIGITPDQISVVLPHVRFFSRLIEGNFPDVSRILPTVFCNSCTLSAAEFAEAVERAALLARDVQNQEIRLHLRHQDIEISSHSPEVGHLTELISPSALDGPDLLLGCNARFLTDALRAFGPEVIDIRFTGIGSAFVLTAHGSSENPPLVEHLQLILPLRIVAG
jgi:DNA polymerase-3 subunit beta